MKKLLFAAAAALALVGPACATISQSTVVAVDQGNGSTTVFNYSFLIPYQANGTTPAVVVQTEDPNGNITTLTPSQYTIAGVGNASGGTVTYNPGTPLPTGWKLIISRALAYVQPIAVTNFSFYPHTVEVSADQLEAQIQQLANQLTRVPIVPVGEALLPLPSAPQRASTIFEFDANGQPSLVPVSGTLPPIGSTIPVVANNTALSTLPASLYKSAVRLGFAAEGDAPPLIYTSSSSACSLNAGAGDGGSQVPTSDSGCWIANFPNGGLRIEWWGISQAAVGGIPAFHLYVNSAGSDTSNYCTIQALPCATWTHAVAEANLFDAEAGNIIIHSTDSAPHTYVGSLIVNNPLRGGASASAYPGNGLFNPSKIVLDGNSQDTIQGSTSGVCYAIAANNGGMLGLENITVKADTAACSNGQDGLFAQQNGGIDIYGGVTLGATGSVGYKAHAESTAYGIQVWANYTITGNGDGFVSLGPDAEFLVSSGTGTITGSPTFGGPFLLVGSNSVAQFNQVDPFGASPGTITGVAFGVLPSGTIETQGNVIHWPGTAGILYGGVYRGDGIISGTTPGTIGGATGLGSTGTYSITGNSYHGKITLSPSGSGIAALGDFGITFPFVVQYTNGAQGVCSVAFGKDGTGAWNQGATVLGNLAETTPGAGTLFTWNNNTTVLSSGSTYTLYYSCQSGS